MQYNYILSHDTVDNIVQEVLIDDFKSLSTSILELESLPERKPYQQEDLDHDRMVIAAIKVLLSYYLPADQYYEVIGDQFCAESMRAE